MANALIDPKLKVVHFKAVSTLKDLVVVVSLSTQEAPRMLEMPIEVLHIVLDVFGQTLESQVGSFMRTIVSH